MLKSKVFNADFVFDADEVSSIKKPAPVKSKKRKAKEMSDDEADQEQTEIDNSFITKQDTVRVKTSSSKVTNSYTYTYYHKKSIFCKCNLTEA